MLPGSTRLSRRLCGAKSLSPISSPCTMGLFCWGFCGVGFFCFTVNWFMSGVGESRAETPLADKMPFRERHTRCSVWPPSPTVLAYRAAKDSKITADDYSGCFLSRSRRIPTSGYHQKNTIAGPEQFKNHLPNPNCKSQSRDTQEAKWHNFSRSRRRLSPEKQLPEGFPVALPKDWLFLYIFLLPSFILFCSKSVTGVRENTHRLHLVYAESHSGFARHKNLRLMQNRQFPLERETNRVIKITFSQHK